MSSPAAKVTDPHQAQVTVTGFLRREVVNTAWLYFAPVTAVMRTIGDVWAASGLVTQIRPDLLHAHPLPFAGLPKTDDSDSSQHIQSVAHD